MVIQKGYQRKPVEITILTNLCSQYEEEAVYTGNCQTDRTIKLLFCFFSSPLIFCGQL